MLLASRLRDKFPFYYGWIVVGAAGTVVFARMAPAITTLTVLIFPMSQQLGWSRTLIAGSVSAGALAALVLSPVVGWAIDRFGARPVLAVSVTGLGLAMISLAWATTPLTFYIAFAAARVVFHTSAPIGASTVAARWFIRKRGRAIGMIFLFGAIGGIVFTMLASLVVENHGLKATWIAIGLVVLLFSVAPSLLLQQVGQPPSTMDPSNQKHHQQVQSIQLQPCPISQRLERVGIYLEMKPKNNSLRFLRIPRKKPQRHPSMQWASCGFFSIDRDDQLLQFLVQLLS